MKILVCVLRPLLYEGLSYPAGATIKAEPLAAHEIISSGRAALADSADARRMYAAVAEHRDRLLGTLNAAERQRAAAGWVRRVA